MGGRDRGYPLDVGAFTYGDLLRDGIARTKLTSAAGDYTLRRTGLKPSTAYNIRIWGPSSGADVNTTYSWFDTTTNSNPLGSFLNGPSLFVATNNNDYSVFGTVTSDANGFLRF
jgi:hypothetical protein